MKFQSINGIGDFYNCGCLFACSTVHQYCNIQLMPYLFLLNFNIKLASADIFSALQEIIRLAKKHNIKQSGINFTSMEEIGILLRRYREEKGLSQENIADSIGVTSSNISKIEMGKTKPKFETIEKYCKAMDTSLAAILSSEENLRMNICDIKLNINVSDAASLKECLKVLDEHKYRINK